ncbi:MAG: glutamate--tRNA ligase [Anaerolineaceae bacterium]|jgi:glutamyl-tRNA synthetase|nr:MAG: glutamate--tRNA ligase [Anaerolineaceae bacterium]
MTQAMKPVRVRFAPSPTGHLHLGSARTALYDYLIARKTGGQFILRIEDTDRKRFVEGAEEELMSNLRWLGLGWDEGPDIGGPYGPYRQSDRKEIYQRYGEKLVELGCAYYCFCTPERLAKVRDEKQKRKEPPHYDRTCRTIPIEEARRRIAAGEAHVLRFKTPTGGVTIVKDLLRGEITFENKTLDDYILIKSDGWALYHLAAAVDDHLMKITHVVRSSEWLPTSPIHSLIHQAFGWEEPVWVHLSVLLKPSGKGKMSKREAAELSSDGYSIFIKDMQGLGYLPEAVVNWVALMGWSYDDHTEFFTMQDLIEKFSLEKLNPAPAATNFTKFDYFNKLHIKALSDAELAERMQPYFEKTGIHADKKILEKIAPIVKERIITLDDAVEMAKFFFTKEITYSKERMLIEGCDSQGTIAIGRKILEALKSLEVWSAAALDPLMRAMMEKEGKDPRQFLGFLREVVSGQKVSPPLFESMEILGKPVVLQRLEDALRFIEKNFD